MKFPKDKEDRDIATFIMIMYSIVFLVIAGLLSVSYFLSSAAELVK